MENIGGRIKKYRKDRGFTQQQLADSIKKSKSIIQKYEANSTMPPIDALGDIATNLTIPIDFLIGSELIPMQDKDGEFSYMVDSQFGCFDPSSEGYMEFLERKLSGLDEYKKDNVFVSPSYPSFTSEVITCINKSYQDYNNKLLSIYDLNSFLEEETGIENVKMINDENELPIPELIKLLNFYKNYNFDDFCKFIMGCQFGFSDFDISIKSIINDYKHSITKKVSMPGGFVSKPSIITPGLAYESLINLLFYINNGKDLPIIDDDMYEILLNKVTDLLEFELFKLEKSKEDETVNFKYGIPKVMHISNKEGE